MFKGKTVHLVLPARDEAEALPLVLNSVPAWVDSVWVVDNGSTDATAEVAEKLGAVVISEPIAGYGRACLAALSAMAESLPDLADLVAFADADGSDDLSRLAELAAPVASGAIDLALARRVEAEPGALSPQQRFGNRLTTRLIKLFWSYEYADLGPFRVVSWPALRAMGMGDRGCGWTVEMQIRALRRGLRVREIALPCRPRAAGRSKISRNAWGSLRAGTKILAVVFREAFQSLIGDAFGERKRLDKNRSPKAAVGTAKIAAATASDSIQTPESA